MWGSRDGGDAGRRVHTQAARGNHEPALKSIAGTGGAWAVVAWMPVTAEHSRLARTGVGGVAGCGWCGWAAGALRKLPLEILVELATSDN